MTESETTSAQLLFQLREAERVNLVQLLHDDLGQSLVAIRSMAHAIGEQDDANESREIAGLITQAANDVYRTIYDLMQELRAEDIDERDISHAIEICAEDARLLEYGLKFKLNAEVSSASLDCVSRASLLRNLRSLMNLCRLVQQGQLVIDLTENRDRREIQLTLRLLTTQSVERISEHATLTAIRNRVQAIGGKLRVDVDAETPFKAVVTLPSERFATLQP